jgi:SSS family solute:Na+ symporter
MNFLHFAIFLFVLCSAVLVVVSLATPPPDAAQLAFLDASPADAPPRKRWRRVDAVLSLALVGIVAAMWIVFR